MQLRNTFTVSLPVDRTWDTFIDLERIAPCLPGAAITDVQGDNYVGGVKIKVGPISAQYQGTVAFVEKDETAHRAVISAKGKDVGGQGNAEATIVATLTPHGDGTQVEVETDLDLSGRVAQFGRGVIGDVTARLLGQFAKNLEKEITSGALGDAPDGQRPIDSRPPQSLDDVEALDVMNNLGAGLLLKYAVPALSVVVLAGLGAAWLRRDNRERPFVDGPTRGFEARAVNIYLTLPGLSQYPRSAETRGLS